MINEQNVRNTLNFFEQIQDKIQYLKADPRFNQEFRFKDLYQNKFKISAEPYFWVNVQDNLRFLNLYRRSLALIDNTIKDQRDEEVTGLDTDELGLIFNTEGIFSYGGVTYTSYDVLGGAQSIQAPKVIELLKILVTDGREKLFSVFDTKIAEYYAKLTAVKPVTR